MKEQLPSIEPNDWRARDLQDTEVPENEDEEAAHLPALTIAMETALSRAPFL
jgi:hypothetical protein